MNSFESTQSHLEIDGVPRERIPRHIAIIMDGNGRWAAQRDEPRFKGHRAGVESARRIVEHSARVGIGTLTLYSFSQENWKRPASEVDALMGLLVEVLPLEQETLLKNNVRLRVIGSRAGLPDDVLHELDTACERTAHCTGLQLNIAMNYGSRQEIVEAARSLAARAREGSIEPDHIDEKMFSDSLWTGGQPDPDLLIRTAGEYRVSNYLLWQISYAEIHVSSLHWPDFDEAALEDAIRDFAGRNRRFGSLENA